MDSSEQTTQSAPEASIWSAERLLTLGIAVLVVGLLVGLWLRDNRGNDSASSGIVTSGATAAEFSLPGLSGETVRLSDYRGRVVLVNFWATWCPPCKAEMPELEAVYRAHKDDGFVILGVDQGESADEVRSFVESRGFTWVFALDQDGEVSQQYGAFGIPQSYLIDRDGKVVAVWEGPLTRRELESELQKLGIGV